MSTSCPVTEVARNFADYINRVVCRGERFVLIRGNRPVAEFGPIRRGRRLGELPDIIASSPPLSRDEAEAFARDIEVARR